MRKLVILTAAVFVTVAGCLWATDTRTLTMGDNNLVLLDEHNIFLFPGRIIEYPNLAVGEFNSDDFRRFGIHWKFGEKKPFVVGTYFENNAPIAPDDLMGNSLVSFDLALQDNRRINLIYGRMLGDYKFGFGLDMLHSSQTSDSPGDDSKESFSFYDFTFSVTPEGGAFDVAVDFGLGTFTDQDAAGVDETKPNGYTEFSLLGRYFLKQNPTNVWILHAGVALAKHGAEVYNLDATNDLDSTQSNTLTLLDAGIGLNYEPTNNVLAVADFGFQYGKIKQENDTTNGYITTLNLSRTESWTTLPYFKIGLDAQVLHWMDIRLSATSFWDNNATETSFSLTRSKQKTRLANNETYLGLGFHWGNLQVDTYTDPELFLDGLNFVSGTTNNMNFQISVLYRM